MSRLVIGFGHKRLRGKDTSAEYALQILRALNLPARADSFAYSLKKGIGRHVFGFSDEQLYGGLKETTDPFWGFTPRFALQKAGTEAMRQGFSPDIWARSLERRALQSPDEHVVISDVRFLEEIEVVQMLDGIVVRCDREIPFDAGRDAHQSETALDRFDRWDYEIDNNGTLAALSEQVRDIVMQELKNRGLLRA